MQLRCVGSERSSRKRCSAWRGTGIMLKSDYLEICEPAADVRRPVEAALYKFGAVRQSELGERGFCVYREQIFAYLLRVGKCLYQLCDAVCICIKCRLRYLGKAVGSILLDNAVGESAECRAKQLSVERLRAQLRAGISLVAVEHE